MNATSAIKTSKTTKTSLVNNDSFEVSNANTGHVEDNQLDNNVIDNNFTNFTNLNSRKSNIETDEVVDFIPYNLNNTNTVDVEANIVNNQIEEADLKEAENANNEQYDPQFINQNISNSNININCNNGVNNVQNKLDISNRSKSIDSADKQDQNNQYMDLPLLNNRPPFRQLSPHL